MARPKTQFPDRTAPTVMAHVLGITTQRLGQLVKAGKLERGKDGKYDMPATVAAYVQFKVDDATRNQPGTSTADRLRERRDQEIALRIAKEERTLIPLDEAEAEFEDATGAFLETLSGLPARITRVPRERQRIEAIIDEDRLRLSDRFAKSSKALRTGKPAAEADDEDDA